MATLLGTYPANTYKQLLQIGSGNVGLSASFQTVQDGAGNNSVLQLSTTAVKVNATTITINGQTLTVSATASVGGTNTGDATGTTNEITVTGQVISLPTALTFTGKTVTGGTFSGPTISGTVTTTASYSAPVLLSGTTFADVTDPTKKIQYVLSGITTATTRNITWQDVAGTVYVTGGTDVAVADGGTNFSSYTQGDILYASGTTTLAKLAKDTNSTRYLSNTGTTNNPAWAQIDLSNGVTGDLPFANLTQGSARSVLGVTGNSTADVASIQGTANQALVINSAGTALAFGQVNLASSSAVTGTLPIANLGGKPIVQQVATITGTVSTGTTAIPFDNTIPQITEGDQYMTLAITPSSASNILVIDAGTSSTNSNGATTLTMALFQDATSNALSSACQAIPTGGYIQNLKLHHVMVAGTTSSTTFRIRIGGSTGATTTFNGSAGAGFDNGVLNSYIHIIEITV